MSIHGHLTDPLAVQLIDTYMSTDKVPYHNDVLRHTYELLKTNSYNNINIPHSDVFYVRAAIINKYGTCGYSLNELEDIMREFNWTLPDD